MTAGDPRSSSSTTYSTVFSGYVPGGLHTVSPPAVDAPWTSVSTSYTPYDLSTKHLFSLRVSKGTTTTAAPLSSDSRTFCRPSHVSHKTSSTITCPSQDGAGLERDSTTTPHVSSLSHRETVFTSDRPLLPAVVYSGYDPSGLGLKGLFISNR